VIEHGKRVSETSKKMHPVGTAVAINPQYGCGVCKACRAGLSHVCPNMTLIGIERAGGMAEYVTAPAHRLFRLPKGLSDMEGSMTETLAVEVHLFRRVMTPYTRTVVVLGAGAQGLLAVQLAKVAGAENIVSCDIVPQRLAMARKLGATHTVIGNEEDVVKTVLDLTDGWGADLVVEAVGNARLRQQGQQMLSIGGTLALVGNFNGVTQFDFLPIITKEQRVFGTYCYTDDDFSRALEMIATTQINVKPMLHPAKLEEGVHYFHQLIEEPGALVKVALSA
jgi:2-desacetyl-2-hydroxyethyl bacteriochlorophyllide A dehydrogenase